MRDDIEINSRISSIIHSLANPSLYEPISDSLVNELLLSLNKSDKV